MCDGILTKVDSYDGSAVGRGVLDSLLWRLVSRGLASLTLGDRQCEVSHFETVPYNRMRLQALAALA